MSSLWQLVDVSAVSLQLSGGHWALSDGVRTALVIDTTVLSSVREMKPVTYRRSICLRRGWLFKSATAWCVNPQG